MYRVIVADDEGYVRDLLVKSLARISLDLEVVAAVSNGREALEKAIEWKPDIVITDIAMPFLDGLELIARLQEAGIASKTIIISGYDEFNYARRAISLGVKDYLLKPFLPKDLEEVLGKAVQELDSQRSLMQNLSLLKEQAGNRAMLAREKGLKDLLEGRPIPKDQELIELGVDLSGHWFLAGVIRLDGAFWNFECQKGVEEFLMLAGEGGYFPKDIRMYGVSFDGANLAAMWCGKEEPGGFFMEKVRTGLEKIRKSLKKYYDIRIICTLGNPYDSREGIGRSYLEALNLWRKNQDEEKAILLYGEEPKREEVGSRQIQEWKDQIRFSVRKGNQGEALGHLDMLMKCYASLSSNRGDYIGVSAGELLYAIESDMEQEGYNRERTWLVDAARQRLRYGNLADIRQMLEEFIKNCCVLVEERSEENKTDALVKQIKLLVGDNLSNEDVGLEWVAEQLHFSTSYIRQTFKQVAGENLGEYLIRRRMELAGKLLQNTSLMIQEVARECGYGDQRYFASSFKKFYRCTPTQFKKAVEKERLY